MAAYRIEFTESAKIDISHFAASHRRRIVDEMKRQLLYQPLVETRNRKPLRPNDLSVWQIRLGRYRVFYDVAGECMTVTVKAIGWKQHDALFIRGKEFQL